MSSLGDEYCTPPALAAYLVDRFQLDLDVCARFNSACCREFFGPPGFDYSSICPEMNSVTRPILAGENGLLHSWLGRRCWMNPPYSKPLPWLMRAADHAKSSGVLVALIRIDPSTEWWNYVDGVAQEVWWTPRLKFIGGDQVYNFPTGVVIYDGLIRTSTKYCKWPGEFTKAMRGLE